MAPFRMIALAACTAVLAAASAAAAYSAAPASVIAALNAERAGNGLPPVVEEPSWSAKCRAHDDYERRNGVFGHDESPSLPGYSADGAWAGAHAVLSVGSSWAGGADPFATAPIHLIQLLNPLLARVGADDRSGYVCVTTWPGYVYDRFRSPRVFTYPGDGATGVPAAEQAAELPFVPGDFVGLPGGTTTGFHIMAWAVGLGTSTARLVSATLTGPGGEAVPIRTLDASQPQVGPYLGPGAALVIPVSPLHVATTYAASVTFTGAEGRKVSYGWSFTTAGTRQALAATGLAPRRARRKERSTAAWTGARPSRR